MNESSATGNSVTIDPLRVFHAIPEYVQGTGTAVVGKPPPAASSTGTASAALADNPLSKRNRAINRKTSAEIVQEAKTMLSRGTPSNSTMSHNSLQSNASTLKFDGSFKVSGARLVSTRRPITPREPGRQLYGRAAPPGRPPSAFSLRYLQFESRALPNLEPIPQGVHHSFDVADMEQELGAGGGGGAVTVAGQQVGKAFQRSESTGSIADFSRESQSGDNGLLGLRVTGPLGTAAGGGGMGKLPALLIPPKIAASLDNLSEGMPPRKDFRQPREIGSAIGTDGPAVESSGTATGAGGGVVELLNRSAEHPMKRMQAKSHDGHGISLELAAAGKGNSFKDSANALKLNRSNDLLAQSSTETLLDMLKAHSGIKECSDETVQHINGILTELYSRVKGARGRWRGAVLGALYGLVECVSSKILLSVARVVLALRVTGSNLTGACKLIFKVARNETNDSLFIDCDVAELLIEGLGRASPLEEPEACVYGYGAVRFLANSHLVASGKDPLMRNKCLAYRLAHHGAVQLMVVHLQILNEAGNGNALSGAPLHALFQLSSALRALAGNPMVIQAVNNQNNSVFLTTSTSKEIPQIKESLEGYDIQMELAGPHLVKSAEICMTETETQFNIIRTLSALSDIEKCCAALSDHAARLAVLLGPCPNDDDEDVMEKPLGLLSRLGYILGNIVGKYDSSRLNIFNNDVAMEQLINSLRYYSQQKLKTASSASGEDSVVDVAVKLVRVIANMGVNSEVGQGLVQRPVLGNILLDLIESVTEIVKAKQPVGGGGGVVDEAGGIEELLLATLGALHNLSFYSDLETAEKTLNGTVNDRISDLSSALVMILRCGSIAAQAEAARVLGNMSRSFLAREAVCHSGGLKILIKNLESEDFELVASSCGVLVNILGDWERRASFRELKGPILLRDVLQRSATQEDWLLAAIVCQALWNYLIDTTDLVGALGEDEADYIAGDLMEYLEEGGKYHELAKSDELYEQFCSVATDLLERIQSSMSSLTNSPALSIDDDDADDVDVVGEIGDKWGGRFKEWLQQ